MSQVANAARNLATVVNKAATTDPWVSTSVSHAASAAGNLDTVSE